MLVLRTIELREWIWCLWQRHLVIKGVYFPFFYYKGGLSKTSLIGGVQSSMGISWNGGTPKSSTLPGFSHINNPFIGTPPPHTNIYIYTYLSEFDDPRKANNHTAANATQWRKTAQAVLFTYGHKYQRAAQYLEDLASNTMWENSDVAPLPWHAQAQVPARPGEPRYVMHQAVLDALAPSVPLRAIFAGARHQWLKPGLPTASEVFQKKVLHRALGLECCWETIYWRNKEFYIILFLQWVPKKGGPNKEFQCTERPDSIFSMHRGSQTKIFDALMVPNQKNRCTEGIKQRFSMHWEVPTKIFDALRSPKQRFRCTWGPPMFLFMIFDALGGVPKLPEIVSMYSRP